MNGTLALWYEGKVLTDASSAATRRPDVRLHVNLWRDLDKEFNFLDVGFLLSGAQDLDRLNLFLPAPLTAARIYDLSTALKDADTLNAVFNDVATLIREDDRDFTVMTATSTRVIHHVDVESDLAVSAINIPGDKQGTIVALKSRICGEIAGDADPLREHYVRLRIFLQDDARNLFTTEDNTAGVGLSLSQDVLETTEFRLNERRSYPPSILQRATAGAVRLASVHYFLIRRKEFQLSSQHTNFRKIRYLEHDIWTNYLNVGHDPARTERNKLADGMIIYQWREVAEGDKSLDDFIAYASFRTARPRILAYFIAILAIGGVGSAAFGVMSAMLSATFLAIGWSKPSDGYLAALAGLVLAMVALLPMTVSAYLTWRRR